MVRRNGIISMKMNNANTCIRQDCWRQASFFLCLEISLKSLNFFLFQNFIKSCLEIFTKTLLRLKGPSDTSVSISMKFYCTLFTLHPTKVHISSSPLFALKSTSHPYKPHKKDKTMAYWLLPVNRLYIFKAPLLLHYF